MKRKLKKIMPAIMLGCAAFAQSATAEVCDYRPSALFGGAGAATAATATGAVAAVGLGAKAAGFFTLTHAVTGATMLGSTAGGASAAGIVGIMGGTGGVIGSVAAGVMAPVTIIVASVSAIGIAVFEGACYFTIERVDDPVQINSIVESLVSQGNEDFIRIEIIEEKKTLVVATEVDEDGHPAEFGKYAFEDLYIEEGLLRHREFGPNTIIGRVTYVSSESEPDKD